MRTQAMMSFLAAPLLLTGCVVIPIGDLLRGPSLEEQVLIRGDGFFSRDKIAIIEVDGVISGSEAGGFLNPLENTVSNVKARLVRIRSDPEVQGVVLRISSPGGEVTACDVIHHEIIEFKKSSKLPVVAVIVDEGASGGYYVASAADLILAQPTSVVGSIGVIMQTFNISGLFQKIGVETLPIKSAEKKDLLSPFRGRTEEEKEILQRVVNDFYQRFIEVVAGRAGAPPRDEVLKLADGRIFSGLEAEKLKLVDRVGYVPDAIEEVRRRARVERRPTVIHYARPARSGANIYSLAGGPEGVASGSVQLNLRADGFPPRARFLYLWQP